MPADPDGEDMAEPLLDEEMLDRRLGQIDDTLRDGFERDARLGHGASGESPGNELDFIQMTGLTRPEPEDETKAVEDEPMPESPALKDTSLSFYEPGVRDVDHTMNPNDAETLAPAPTPEDTGDTTEAAAGFRSIADELAEEGLTTSSIAPREPEAEILPAKPEPAVAESVSPESVPESVSETPTVPETPSEHVEGEAKGPVPESINERPEVPETVPEPVKAGEAEPEPGTEPDTIMNALPPESEAPKPSKPSTEDLEALLAEFEDAPISPRGSVVEGTGEDLDALLAEFEEVTEAPSHPQKEAAPDELNVMLDALSGVRPSEEKTVAADVVSTPESPADEPEDHVYPDATPIVPELTEEGRTEFAETRFAPAKRIADHADGGLDELLESAALLHEEKRVPEPNPKLEEAEQLLQALEEVQVKPNDTVTTLQKHGDDVALHTIPEEENNDHVVYDYSAAPVKRRSKSLSRRRTRALRRLALAIVVLVLIGGTSLAAAWWLYPRLQSADDLYTVAKQQRTDGRYELASLSFSQFAAKNPTHPNQADAQFEAARALTLADPPTADAAERLNADALQRFTAFIEANPNHEKRARAETLIGRLHYELGNYAAAIEILRDPVRQLRDPDGALPVLRTLARAYGKTGAIEDARSTYLQAASLASNVTPEVDYYELGELLRVHADAAPERESLLGEAAHYWLMAAQAPGIDPARRDAIQNKLAWLEVGATETDMTETTETVPVAPAEPVPVEDSTETMTTWEADPVEAAEHAAQESVGNNVVTP